TASTRASAPSTSSRTSASTAGPANRSAPCRRSSTRTTSPHAGANTATTTTDFSRNPCPDETSPWARRGAHGSSARSVSILRSSPATRGPTTSRREVLRSRQTAERDNVYLPRSRRSATEWSTTVPVLDESLISVFDEVVKRNPGEDEFHQAVR